MQFAQTKGNKQNMKRELLVFGPKTFKVTIPEDSRITFGPWSPPTGAEKYATSERALVGTLRIYQGKTKTSEDVIGVFSGVTGFRDLSLGYAEEVAKEEGATIWKDDEKGYVRETKVKREKAWVVPQLPAPAEDEEEDVVSYWKI